jgi:MFS transporter, DHA2 family, multidrug resistance protein
MGVKTKTRSTSGSSGGPAARGTNLWLIAVIVSVATFMEVLDTTIANVALR